jgi:hypothetical protein
MAISLQASGNIDTVSPHFKSFHDVNCIDLSGAGYPYNLDIGGIAKSFTPCHIRRRIGAIMAAKSHDNRFKILH